MRIECHAFVLPHQRTFPQGRDQQTRRIFVILTMYGGIRLTIRGGAHPRHIITLSILISPAARQ